MGKKRQKGSSSSISGDECTTPNAKKVFISNSKESKMAEKTKKLNESISLEMLCNKIETMSTRMEDCFTSLKSDMSMIKYEIQVEVEKLRKVVKNIEDSLTFVFAEIDSLKEAVEEQKKEKAEHEKEVEKLKKLIEDKGKVMEELKEKNIALEQYTRRENLRFNNIPEEHNEKAEDCKELVKDIIEEELGLDSSNMRFHAVHRVGRRNERRVRPIIARFLCREDRDKVWANRMKIKTSDRFSDAYVTLDYAREIQKERSILIRAMVKAKEQFPLNGAKVVGRTLIMGSDKYTVHNLSGYLKDANN